jgi:outer membrane protein assembly factor BamB
MQKFLVVHTMLMVLFFPGRDVSSARGASLISADSAQHLGLARNWYNQASVNGAGKLEHFTLHASLALMASSGGMVDCLDAETGIRKWTTRVAQRDYPSLAPAANDQFVVVVHGSKLYNLRLADGKIVWTETLDNLPGAGPAITDKYVIVPMVNGKVVAFELEPTPISFKPAWNYRSDGRALIPPMVTASHVTWSTDKGMVYWASVHNLKLEYRLKLRDGIEAPMAYHTPYFYACCLDGYIHALDDRTGNPAWKFSSGAPFNHPPIAIDGKVYALPNTGGMFCLDGETGREIWFAPGVRDFLSASPDRIYGTDRSGQLCIVDGKSGSRLGQLSLDPTLIKVANSQTDRIYLVSAGGLVQCLRESERNEPVVYKQPSLSHEAPAKTPKKEATPPGEEDSPTMPADAPTEEAPAANPFDGGF